MKRVTFVVLMIACGSFVSQAQFFETTRRTIPTPVDVTAEQPCNPLVDRSLVFGFETLRQSSTAVDLVAGKSIWLPPPYDPLEYLFPYAYNTGGEFPTYNLYWEGSRLCHAPIFLHRIVFGKLRPNVTPPRRDFAIIMSTVPAFIWRSQIFHNRLNDFPLSVQHLDGNAVDGS